MCEKMIIQIWTVIGPLVGVIVGGVIASCIERQKHSLQRSEKLSELKRDALSDLLEQIDVMQNAEIRAQSYISSEGTKPLPDLTSELAIIELKAKQRVVLPEGMYARGVHIALEMDKIRSASNKQVLLNSISDKITTLKHDIKQEFELTFDAK